MKKFLFVVPPLTGHVNPTLSLGKALLDRGHDVAWLSVDKQLKQTLPSGGKYFDIHYGESAHVDRENEVYLNQISSKNITGIESIKFLYDEVLVPLNRYMFKSINEWIIKFKPDVVINDQQLFAASIVAFQKGIKYATSVTAPAAVKMQDDLPGVSQWEDKQIIAVQKEFGLQIDQSVACSEKLALIYTSPDFFGDMTLKSNYRFVGLSTTNRRSNYSFDWDAFHLKARERKVLVSIGTTFDHQFKRDFFAKVVEAFKDKDFSVILVSDPDLFVSWPSNFIVSPQIPQLELLPLMDAVICHGGHNTVCETLMQGIPLVVVPIAYDQSYVAGRVVATGSGLRLNYKRFKANHLADTLQQILTQSHFKEAAQRLQNSFIKTGGVSSAAQFLEDFAMSDAPAYENIHQ